MRSLALLLALLVAPLAHAGVPVAYQLPVEGPLPKTYRVTLAIVEAKNPNWIVSQFACGAVRTVTAENKGKFSEEWNGLDDNFMPVPPGDYAVKGIYMPARQWQVDGEFHTVTPKFFGGISAWLPSPEQWDVPQPFGGDPVNSPLRDVAVGPNGIAVFHYQYLENGLNCPMIDLNKPLGYGQFIRAFNSGGAAGGTCVATDGETVWAFCAEGGPKYVYRPDGKPFGKSPDANRTNGYLPDGWVTAMAAWRDPAAAKSFVYIAQRGKIVVDPDKTRHRSYMESPTEKVDKITIHDGGNGAVLGELPLARPLGLAVQGDTLYALHAEGAGFAVSAIKVGKGVPAGAWKRVFAVPSTIHPADLEVDSHGRFYLSDSAANHVYQLDAAGKPLHTFGRLAAQKSGAYDPETFISPAKLATWRDAQGEDRLLVIENGGPNRTSEWSADGKLLREFTTLQTKANDGYAFDPEHPEDLYIPGHEGWLTRFKFDYAKHTFTVDAVWPHVGDGERRELKKPMVLRAGGRTYLAGSGSGKESAFNIYRLDGDRWVYSAAIFREVLMKGKPGIITTWHDANGNDQVEAEEQQVIDVPNGVFSYHGQNWSDDFSLLALGMGTTDLWRIAAASFDAKGNPVFEAKKVLTDPVFTARAEGKADAIHGGNELAQLFSSDWMQADGDAKEGYFIQARGGKNFSANEGAQHKVSRYVPDAAGGYKLQWRTGRTALERMAEEGEIYGGMRVHKPINGLLSVIDQSRCGVVLYNAEDGLYVDTIFPDGRRLGKRNGGVYPQPGEFFAGVIQPNLANGRIYLGFGKYTPMLFETEGWSLTENPVHKLASLPAKVTISAAQIATPPEIALSLRGGAGKANLARFTPALGEVALDGGLAGWESAEPVVFAQAKDQSVEVRCLYRPEELLLRWHVRLPGKFEARPLPPPERLFSHDQAADTLSFYLQGDVNAPAGGPAEGRPGDVRVVFGLFDNKGKLQPVATGMYPKWQGKGKASPQIYRTPVGTATFAHVGPLESARLTHQLDPDGHGFVLVAAVPRAAFPALSKPFSGGLRTLANFEATFGGHQKNWWANSDGSANRETYDEPSEARLYPGSWAPVEFTGFADGITVRNWLICGPFGGPGAEKFAHDPRGEIKKDVEKFYEAATYPPDNGVVDPTAVFTGEMTNGYWPAPREVRWKPATVADLDNRVILGNGAQLWYAGTWIHAAAPTEVELRFQSHQMTFLRWFVNGERVPLKPADYKPGARERVPVAARKITLRAGWNQVMVRGYCTGYAPFRAGLVVEAPETTLWNLQLSATPPK